jgi:hypothetical protein
VAQVEARADSEWGSPRRWEMGLLGNRIFERSLAIRRKMKHFY